MTCPRIASISLLYSLPYVSAVCRSGADDHKDRKEMIDYHSFFAICIENSYIYTQDTKYKCLFVNTCVCICGSDTSSSIQNYQKE